MKLRKKSQLQERKVAKELNGRVTPASGALDCAKGDVRSDTFLVECKTTSKDFYSLSFNTWYKISSEAIKDGLRIPIMCIDLKDGEKRFAVFCNYDFFSLLPNSFDYPPINITSKSFRIKDEGKVQWLPPRTPKSTYLVIMNWETFVREIVPNIK